ncbi:hypothetical protein FQR65_LT17638 [Abscondita terminalis]|nr:hypothetical protein FQR65_LT17638 [Abscondita terminalis]
MNYALAQIDVPQDFNQDDYYIANREKLYCFSKTDDEAKEQWLKRVKYDLLNLKLSSTGKEDDAAKQKETLQVLPGGPAFRDKSLHMNDKIIGVAQGEKGEFEDIIGWRLDAAVAKIKGPKGTIVRLKIIPAGQEMTAQPKIVSLKREKIVVERRNLLKKRSKWLKEMMAEGEKDPDTPNGAPEFGQINITMAKFYRINGSIHTKGVSPDINFPQPITPQKNS